MKRRQIVIERIFDVVCAGIGLVVLMPVLGGIALAILCTDGPPIFFRQTRVGKYGKLFVIWKFRTMHAGAGGRGITAAGDCRVTRIGARLRKFKLDELPQIINVLKGDMSLIGPRPEVPEYVQFTSPLWWDVLQVKPGITDLATLVHRDEEQILGASADPHAFYRDQVLPAKLHLNLAYLHTRSFRLDIKLIGLTILYSFFPDRFNRDRVTKILGIGAGIHEPDYLHPLSCPVNR